MYPDLTDKQKGELWKLINKVYHKKDTISFRRPEPWRNGFVQVELRNECFDSSMAERYDQIAAQTGTRWAVVPAHRAYGLIARFYAVEGKE